MIKYLIAGVESFQKGGVPEAVRDFMAGAKDGLILLDESSKIKTSNPCRTSAKSKRTQAVVSLNSSAWRRGILTGTFMNKSPVDSYDQMELLQKRFFGCDMYSFAERHTVRVSLPIGRGIRTLITPEIWGAVHRRLAAARAKGPDWHTAALTYCFTQHKLTQEAAVWVETHEAYTPFMHVDEIWSAVSPCCMVVRKQDCTDLPPKAYSVVRVALSDRMKKLYKMLLATGFTDNTVADNSMSMYHQLQDICNGYEPYTDTDGNTSMKRVCSDKMDALDAVLDSIDLTKHQAVIWANRSVFLSDIHAHVKEHTGLMCAKYDGGTPEAMRELVKKRFMSGECRIVCINQGTGSYGLDCLGSADYAVYMSNDYSVERRVQSEDRIDRYREGKERKTIIDIECAGTVDEKVTENLKLGIELIRSGKTDPSVFGLYDSSVLSWKSGEPVVF